MKDGKKLGAFSWRKRTSSEVPGVLQNRVLWPSRQQSPDLGGQKGIDGHTEDGPQ